MRIQPKASNTRKTQTQSMKNHGTAKRNAVRAAARYDSAFQSWANRGARLTHANGHKANAGCVGWGCSGNANAVAKPPRMSQSMFNSVAVTPHVTNDPHAEREHYTGSHEQSARQIHLRFPPSRRHG